MLARKIQHPEREVITRTRGHGHGPITRLVSPSDLGELVKPFVFLDLAVFDGGPRTPMEYLWHPHSGIATVTVMLDGGIRFAETTGEQGLLPKGSVEWMRAGNGVWHTGQAEPGHVKAFQLWIALPPELENGPNAKPLRDARRGARRRDRSRVILGEYGGAQESDRGASDDVPPGQPRRPASAGRTSRRRATRSPGSPSPTAQLRTSLGDPAGELAIFEPSEQALEFRRRRGDTLRDRLGAQAHARSGTRQLLGAHERRGPGARRGRDPSDRQGAARQRDPAEVSRSGGLRGGPGVPISSDHVEDPPDHSDAERRAVSRGEPAHHGRSPPDTEGHRSGATRPRAPRVCRCPAR